ncbi:hypothetical protein C8R46DRAFT_996216 [Mycena filopes]|nr:hypothetical protein C8R46DRAFT_996216 [Mycena filopes]
MNVTSCPCDSTCSLHFASELDSRPMPNSHSDLFPSTAGPPSETQALQILSDIGSAESEMATIAAHIIRLKGALKQLDVHRAKLQHFSDTHKGVLSAIRRFPNEILDKIFQDSLIMPRNTTDSTPWALSQVCSRWRAVAVSLPRLWCHLVLWNDTGRESTFLTKALPLQLERAARAPLTIDFGSGTPPLGVLAPLLRVSPRWENVAIGVELFTSPLFAPNTFSGLKTLKLLVDEDASEYADHVDMLSSFPILNHLELLFMSRLVWFPRTMSFPWTQLRKCVLTSPKLPELVWILGQLSYGTSVAVYGADEYIPSAITLDIISTLITSLTLTDCAGGLLGALFSCLTAPALEIFRVEYTLGPDPGDLSGAHIRQFLERSESRLVHLHLDGPLDEDELVQIIESSHVHGLRRLAIPATLISSRALAPLAFLLPAPHLLVLCETGMDKVTVEATLATNRLLE